MRLNDFNLKLWCIVLGLQILKALIILLLINVNKKIFMNISILYSVDFLNYY